MTSFSDQPSTNLSRQLRRPKPPMIPPATVRTAPAAETATPTSRSQMLRRMRDSQLTSGAKSGNSSGAKTSASMQDKQKEESLKINLRFNGNSKGPMKSLPPPPLPPTSQQATGEQRMAPTNKIGADNEEVWSSVEDLFWDHMKEVQNKWNTLKLNDDIWAKLIYFEQNRRIAKAYVSAPVLTVDGSANGLDGFRIGLSGIENNYRTLNSMSCLRSIGHGIKLKIDNQGNILIRKLGNLHGNANQHKQSIVHPSSSSAASSIAASSASSSSSSSSSSASSSASTSSSSSSALPNSQAQCSVWIKDWPSSSSSTNSALENCTMREIEKSDVSYKLFDMRKFRLQLENRRLNNEKFIDWRQCVSVISFVQTSPEQRTQKMAAGEKRHHQGLQHGKLLDDPCWLMIINIIAIDMLKSSVCDRNNSSSPTSQSNEISSLIQNHQSLSVAATRSSASSRFNFPTNSADPLAAPTNKSSLSQADSAILAAAKQQAKKQGQYLDNLSNSNSSNGSSAGNFLAPGRLKKLRSTSSRYRMNMPGMVRLGGDDPLSNYRRYQSAQQLSPTNSNSIYTTFNSNNRFISSSLASTKLHQHNHHNYVHLHQHQHQHPNQYHQAPHSHFRTGFGGDNSSLSNSDYHSASRSTSSSQNNYYHLIQRNRSSSPAHYLPLRYHPNRQLKQFERQATENVHSHNYQDDSRIMFARKAQLSSNKKNLSLSNFDLSPRQRRLDFSAMRSSIKMNFDDFDGEDDVGDDDCDEIIGLCQQQAGADNDTEIKQRQQRCCELTEELKQNQVNHHECHATHGHSQESKEPQLPATDDGEEQKEQEREEETKTKEQQRQQKISRSSIGSTSTASSGCADNDYFTSQSSSSMSSSTGSNERDLFSQPASSSGIAGSSGNTSDEYTYETNKLSLDSSEVAAPIVAVAAAADKLANANDDAKAIHSRQMKTVAATTSITTKTSDIKKQSGVGAKLHRRGYRVKHVEESLVASDFCCNQIESLSGSHVQEQHQMEDLEDCDCVLTESDGSYECDCCCDCSYSELAANNQITSTAKAAAATTTVESTVVESALGGFQKVAASCGCDDESSIYCRLPHPARLSNNPTKQHQPTKWLDRRRRYGVMLTRSSKFYSPNGNNGCQVNDSQESTQRRSNGNDLNMEDKFRLTRSTQELSS